jgi:hypothetical protein
MKVRSVLLVVALSLPAAAVTLPTTASATGASCQTGETRGGFNFAWSACPTATGGSSFNITVSSTVTPTNYADCAVPVAVQQDGLAFTSFTVRPCNTTQTFPISAPAGHVYTVESYGYVYKTGPNYTDHLTGQYVDLSGASTCDTKNTCTPTSFALRMLTYSGIAARVTAANLYSLDRWQVKESGSGCPGDTAGWPTGNAVGNPLNTTQPEPGSTKYNSVGVQSYHATTSPAGTCWHWGIKATGDTLINGNYPDILSTLRTPQLSNHDQCVALSTLAGMNTWGSGNWSSYC